MIKKIVSGGQTGADRGGLEAAKNAGIQTGGYCPYGYLTENGYDLSLLEFGLKQTKSRGYIERTILNIKYSDGTVIFSKVNSSEKIEHDGSLLTLRTCKKLRKPVILNPTAKEFTEWIKENKISVLNIAGNRESVNPGIKRRVKMFLAKALKMNIN